MDRNYWNHICNSLNQRRRPGTPPRANLDNISLNMNDFLDIYENRILNIQSADLDHDFHVAMSHGGITPREYIFQHSKHPLKRYYQHDRLPSRKLICSSMRHWLYLRIGLLWDIPYLTVSVVLFILGVLPLFEGKTNFQSLVYFSIFFVANLGLPGVNVLSARMRDLVIRVSMYVSISLIIVRVVFEIIRVFSDFNFKDDETFQISTTSGSWYVLFLFLFIYTLFLFMSLNLLV
jgi:hypothetical protein